MIIFTVDNNDFTGTMPSGICNLEELLQLEADCQLDPNTGVREIECDCCTKCY